MVYNPEIHKRKSIRLKEYDYGKPGLYFVTICSYKRELLFTDINNGEIILAEWFKTPNKKPNIRLDEFVVMPNHVHGIIQIVEYGNAGAYCNTPLRSIDADPSGNLKRRPD